MVSNAVQKIGALKLASEVTVNGSGEKVAQMSNVLRGLVKVLLVVARQVKIQGLLNSLLTDIDLSKKVCSTIEVDSISEYFF